jgi:hypothetical protein
VLLIACLLVAAGCGDDDRTTSVVSGEERFTSDTESLAPLLVTARQPVVPFKASNGRFIVSYELQLLNGDAADTGADERRDSRSRWDRH